jgi:hypothetical protein
MAEFAPGSVRPILSCRVDARAAATVLIASGTPVVINPIARSASRNRLQNGDAVAVLQRAIQIIQPPTIDFVQEAEHVRSKLSRLIVQVANVKGAPVRARGRAPGRAPLRRLIELSAARSNS